MKRSLNVLATLAGAFALIFAAAMAVATNVGDSAAIAAEPSAYLVETLPAPPATTRASTAYFDGINEGVIAIGAYE